MRERKPTNKMSQRHAFFLYDLLKEVCKSKNGFSVYREGHNDHTTAVTAVRRWNTAHPNETFTFTATHVAGARREAFGNFAEDKTPPRTESIKALRAEIEQLKVRLDKLEKKTLPIRNGPDKEL